MKRPIAAGALLEIEGFLEAESSCIRLSRESRRDAVAFALLEGGPDGVFFWTILLCPYCGRRHQHGGGVSDPRTVLTPRAAHCENSSTGRNYVLVDAAPLWSEYLIQKWDRSRRPTL